MAYNQNYSQRRSDEVRFDLMEHIGVLGKRDNGWTKEVNIIAWNGGKAKVDIRDWDPDHARMSRGITLFEEEAESLVKALARRYGLRYVSKPPAGNEKHMEPVHTERPDVLFDEPAAPASAEAHDLTAGEANAEEIPFEEAAAAQC